MKKTINGKRYDTDKAELIAAHESSRPRTDFHWYYERLYKTPRGRLFLWGIGNAFSRYASHTGDSSCAGERVLEINVDDAVQWLADTDNEAAIDAYFEDTVQDA